MNQNSCSRIIADQTERALWEVKNVIDCVPGAYWDKEYCRMPLWKHVYHMLHSLDVWMINPCDVDFKEPPFHQKGLNDLNVKTEKRLSRNEINAYYFQIRDKIRQYTASLQDESLLEMPKGCEYTRFTLIMAQLRHLHTHMGMIMGFIIMETGLWPRVVGLEGEIPQGSVEKYF